jgi:CHAT domain-containing protein
VVFLLLILVVCLLADIVGSLPKTAATNKEMFELAPGSSISRDPSAGDNEQYEISLSKDQLLRLSIDKGDLALALVLYDPAGKKLLEQVSHGYEVLDVSIITDAAGPHRLEVQSLELNDARRNYEIRLESIRTATVEDRRGFAAQQAIASASLRRADWTEKSLRQAIENYDEAAHLWQASGNLRSASLALMEAGEVCFAMGEYREALKRQQRAAEVARLARAKLEESKAKTQIGLLQSYLGNNDDGQKQILGELDFLAEPNGVNNPGSVKQAYAEALSNLGEINYSKGDMVKSLAHFEQALKLFLEVGDRKGQARVHLFQGYIAGGLGEPEKAVTEVSQALDLYRAVANKQGEGWSLTALGLSHSVKRDEEHAIRMHREATDIFRAIGDRQSEGIALNGLGQAYENLGEYPTAVQHFRRALTVFQESGNVDFASVTVCQIARVHKTAGDIDQALNDYKECLRLSRSAKKHRTEANALNAVAVIYASRGNRQQTVRQYGRILEFYQGINDRRGQAVALNNVGDFFLGLGENQKAWDSYKRALPPSQEAGDPGVLIATLYNLARADRDLGALDDALLYIKQSLDIIEGLRTKVASPEFRTSYFAGVRKHYDLCIDILMQMDRHRPAQGFAVEALMVSEKARARSLIDIISESKADIRQGVTPEDLERERELQGLLRSQARYQMDLTVTGQNQNESSEVARQINQLEIQYQEIEGQLRNQNPRFLMLTKPAPLSLERIQAELVDGNTIFLEYALGDRRSYLWAVTSQSIQSYELPARATLEDAGREVYKLLTARQQIGEKLDGSYQANVEASDGLYYEKALKLSQMLLGPLAEQLGEKRLVVVTEGVLQYVPLDALPEPPKQIAGQTNKETQPDQPENSSPLIARHEIVTLPSISTLAAIRHEKSRARSSNKVVAVLADPVFSDKDDRVESGKPNTAITSADQTPSQPALADFERFARDAGVSRLVHSSEEADAILQTTAGDSAMVARGFAASRETAMSQRVGEYKILHFATHGFLNSEHPELSGLVLTMVDHDGRGINGFMPLHDIYNLNLSADLVVLSACDTALGKDIKGEGLVGITGGFMSAGSKSVVASLWKVDDRATAALMAEFYKAMLQDGMPPVAALRSAKQSIRQKKAWSAPYFWAGFVLQGDYNQRITVYRRSWFRLGLAVSLLLILISSGMMIFQKRRRRS